jgi:hypothetical protein
MSLWNNGVQLPGMMLQKVFFSSKKQKILRNVAKEFIYKITDPYMIYTYIQSLTSALG